MEQPTRQTLAIQIAGRIHQRIRRRNMQPGDALGTELGLAEEFDVSRNVVREAIGRLRALGIVRSRQRTGLVVGQTDPIRLFEQGLPLFLSGESANIFELAKLRYVLETGAVHLAVQHASDAQIHRMAALSDRMARMVQQNREDQADSLEAQFHGLILEATDSQLLSRMHVVVSRYFAETSNRVSQFGRMEAKDAMEHQRIAQAFARRDAETAQRYLEQHLRMILDHVGSKEQEDWPDCSDAI
ncbi:MAG: FCD domain-containing protein [Candidatus Latescibacterota bacterium]